MKSVFFDIKSEVQAGGGGYAAILAACAIVVAALLIVLGYGIGDPWTVAAWCVIAAVSERGLVRLTSTTSQSISILPTLFAAVLVSLTTTVPIAPMTAINVTAMAI